MTAKLKSEHKSKRHHYIALFILFVIGATGVAAPYGGLLNRSEVCTLADHIRASNTGNAIGGCSAGNGDVTFQLNGNMVLTRLLPQITSKITVEGNGFTIDGGAEHQIFDVKGGALHIKHLNITRGKAHEGGDIKLTDSAELVLQSSTISDNSATYGGAISGEKSSIKIVESAFINNRAAEHGGAIILKWSDLEMADSQITGSRARSGGGLLARYSTVSLDGVTVRTNVINRWQSGAGIRSEDSDVSISGSHIYGNHNSRHGGGIYVSGGSLSLAKSELRDNSATFGGGISIRKSTVEIVNSRLSRNYAKRRGGGIQGNGGHIEIRHSNFNENQAEYGGGIDIGSRLIIRGSKFIGNTAAYGGGINISAGSATHFDTTFEDNSALYFGGAVAITEGNAVFEGGGFRDNRSIGHGGAIYIEGGKLEARNATLTGNSTEFNGGGLYNHGGEANLTHMTIAQNTSKNLGGGVYNAEGTFRVLSSIIADNSGEDCFTAEDLSVNRDNLIADGSCDPMISGDPLLGPLSGSPAYFALRTGSPALDAADPFFCPVADQRGAARPQGKACDIGAYELKIEP
ncbi:MAG: hypothetical protein OXG53_16025 [Chloroflexi bacterium]|nr:hypothetical protein [Chloroflexota bacterium]